MGYVGGDAQQIDVCLVPPMANSWICVRDSKACAKAVDSFFVREHDFTVIAQSVAGRGNPKILRRNGAHRRFFCVRCVALAFYGGRVGQLSSWPGSLVPGFHPDTSATLFAQRVVGGSFSQTTR